ncbi:DUF1223 domain-containing protein [Thioclava pacifica]|uniref:DUF1223 domain-containing protein n=1 Tax=Thioclava pacifica DSM 10166 TaxID=1353537 RepID=A0A074JKS3_9RHOB|nr:DUF1223 domain-containing protein [Thioclava pacifica]KEO56495.1 hypothetical protein TP2_02915 [Thioclava pacifica DSM 10166]
MVRAGSFTAIWIGMAAALGGVAMPEYVRADDIASGTGATYVPDAPPGMRLRVSEAMVQSMAPDAEASVQRVSSEETNAGPVVVELFTSQGCSSCPPADALFEEIAERPDVIALALHVDYWDYLGWKDPFGKPEFTARQKAYALAAGERTVYTPQMIVEGREALVGPQRTDLLAAITREAEEAQPVKLTIEGQGGRYEVSLSPVDGASEPAVVQVVRYQPQATVDILRGENAGRTVTYSNIVTSWRAVADWDGKTPTTLSIELEGEAPAVLIVQAARQGHSLPLPGPILAAGRLD